MIHVSLAFKAIFVVSTIIIGIGACNYESFKEKQAKSVVKEENVEDEDIDEYWFPDCGDEEED